MAKNKDSFGDSPLGSGGRFAECVRQMRKKPSVYDPEGLCASIGRKKYGKRRFQKMAARGRKNPADWLAFEHLEQAIRHLRRAHRSVEIAQSELDPVVRPGARTSADAALWQDFERLANAISAVGQNAQRLLESTGADFLDNPETGGKRPPVGSTLDNGYTVEESAMVDKQYGVVMARSPSGHQFAVWHYNSDDNATPQTFWGDYFRSYDEALNAYTKLRDEQHRIARRRRENPHPEGGLRPPPDEPVRDGRWHRDDFVSPGTPRSGPKRGTLYTMATAKGRARILPYRPRTFPESVTAAQTYESATLQKPPKGARWLAFVWSEADWKIATGEFWSAKEGDGLPKASAHRTLDEAKIAAENALRRLPMPNPAARLTNEGILAGSTPIPSGLDRPRYQEGILAGSQPIPSGFGWPSTNAGVVDPPVARRTKPRQPK